MGEETVGVVEGGGGEEGIHSVVVMQVLSNFISGFRSSPVETIGYVCAHGYISKKMVFPNANIRYSFGRNCCRIKYSFVNSRNKAFPRQKLIAESFVFLRKVSLQFFSGPIARYWNEQRGENCSEFKVVAFFSKYAPEFEGSYHTHFETILNASWKDSLNKNEVSMCFAQWE